MELAAWPENFQGEPGIVPRHMVLCTLTLFSKLLQREIVTHSLLRHRNIVPLLGVFREAQNEPPMMILPFMERGSASDYLETLVAIDTETLALTIVRIVRTFAETMSPFVF